MPSLVIQYVRPPMRASDAPAERVASSDPLTKVLLFNNLAPVVFGIFNHDIDSAVAWANVGE